MKAEKNIIFVGGVHGVGKGYVCSYINSRNENVLHLSASDVLKWENNINKTVDNIDSNQNRLIANLSNIVRKSNRYLLDGHFCLLDTNFKISFIDIDTFMQINPIGILVIKEDPVIIKKRLEDRDSQIYDLDLITEFQECEIQRAIYVSKELKIKYHVFNSSELNNIEKTVLRLFSTYK